jgi:hypothetical protein
MIRRYLEWQVRREREFWDGDLETKIRTIVVNFVLILVVTPIVLVVLGLLLWALFAV